MISYASDESSIYQSVPYLYQRWRWSIYLYRKWLSGSPYQQEAILDLLLLLLQDFSVLLVVDVSQHSIVNGSAISISRDPWDSWISIWAILYPTRISSHIFRYIISIQYTKSHWSTVSLSMSVHEKNDNLIERYSSLVGISPLSGSGHYEV